MTSVVDQLREYRAVLEDAVPVVDLESIMESLPTDVEFVDVEILSERPRRWGRDLVLAAVAASLVIGIAVALFRDGDESSDPVTTDEGPEDVFDQLNELELADIPSFRATGTYDLAQDTMQFSVVMQTEYLTNGAGVRLSVLEGDPRVVASGTVSAWFESRASFFEPHEGGDVESWDVTIPEPAIHPITWQSDFSDVCDREDVEILGTITVLGRAALRLRCVNLRGAWEMTLHAESGLILSLQGSYSTSDGDPGIGVSSDAAGGFELTELVVAPDFDEAAFRADLASIEVSETLGGGSFAFLSDLPPLHIVHSSTVYREILEAEAPEFEITGDQVVVTELWYRAPDEWRIEYLRGDEPYATVAGTFIVRNGDEAFRYEASDDTWDAIPVAGEAEGINPLGWVGLHRLEDEHHGPCDSETESEVDTRSVQVVAGCVIPGGPDPFAAEVARRRSLPLTVTYEIDAATQLITGYQAPSGHAEVTTFEIDPVFPGAIFDLTPPEGVYDVTKGEYPPPPPSELVGQPAPPLPISLANGGELHTAALDGRPLAVLFWASWCLPCLDALEEFQVAAAADATDAGYLAVAVGDSVSQVSEVVGRGGIDLTVPVDEGNSTMERWELLGVPTLALVSPDGTVAEMLVGTEVIERLRDLPHDSW